MAPADAPPTHDSTAIQRWRAQEGIRQQELRLASQAASLTAMEARATSLLTWSVGGITALSLSMAGTAIRPGMVLASVLLAFAGLCCVIALWPRVWLVAGFESLWEDELNLASITKIQESMATSYMEGIVSNDDRLNQFGRSLSVAWLLFLAAPVVGLAITIPIVAQLYGL